MRWPRIPAPALAALLAALLGAGAHAQTAPEKKADPNALREVEAKIKRDRAAEAELKKKTEAMRAEIRELRDRLVSSAAATQGREAELARLEGEVRTLETRERTAAQDFQRRQQQLSEILAALQRISLRPPAVIAMRAEDANDTVRSALLLRGLVPELENRARVLRQEIEAYAALRQMIRDRRQGAARVDGALDQDRKSMAALLERKAQLLRETQDEQFRVQQRLEELTEEAENLRELLAKMRADRAKPEFARAAPRTAALTEPPAKRSMAAARGKLAVPAIGRLTLAFEPDKDGQFNKGVLIEARKGAQVVAPYDGQVMYAGPFRSYGRILIIEHSDGYLSVLTGMDRLDVIPRQWVLAGEPIGTVGETEGAGTRLYYELRHQDRPINPQPWLAAGKS